MGKHPTTYSGTPIAARQGRGMTLAQYQDKAMDFNLPSTNNDAYMLLGLTEEVGELNAIIAKGIRSGVARIDDNGDVVMAVRRETHDEEQLKRWHELEDKLLSELGDVLWMLTGACHTLGYTLQQVADANLAKLAHRAATGTIENHTDH